MLFLKSSHNSGLIFLVLIAAGRPALAADCNRNGVDDALDIRPADGHSPYRSVFFPSVLQGFSDLDGDGDLDLITLSSALINDGKGGLVETQVVPWTWQVQKALAVDIDGDGDQDLVQGLRGCTTCPENFEPRIVVFLNQGNGLFTQSVETKIPFSADDISGMVALDFDGDSRIDLAMASGYRVSVFWGQGDGTFLDPLDIDISTSYLQSLQAGDLNRDGSADLGIADEAGVSLLLYQGGRTFRKLDIPKDDPQASPRSLVIADLDADGALDLALGNGEPGTVSVYWNDGAGDFTEKKTLAAGAWAGFLTAVDIDQDGFLDLLVGTPRGPAYTLRNSGHRDFESALRFFSPFGFELVDARFADLNGDGHQDLAANMWIPSRGQGLGGGLALGVTLLEGGLREPAKNFVSNTVGTRAVAGADLDGDRRQDLAALIDSGVSVLFQDRQGDFGHAGDYPVQDGEGSSLVTGDFNGDGSIDLAVFNQNQNAVSLLFNRGNGAFGEPHNFPVGSSNVQDGNLSNIFALDFDEDGDTDLVAGGHLLLNDGQGAFQDGGELGSIDGPCPLFPQTAADFDGDEIADLVYSGVCGTNQSAVALIAGSKDEEVIVELEPEGSVLRVQAADLNGDRHPDLIMHRERGVSFLLNEGHGLFTALPDHLWNPFGGPPAPIDLNGDGLVDLAVPGWAGISIYWNRTVPPASFDSNWNGVPDECERRFHRGDPNSSGVTDISDSLTVLGYLFLGNPARLFCMESADVNNDGVVDISDGVSLLGWLFAGGNEPWLPGPTTRACGFDPDPPGSPGDLGCEVYAVCQ